MQNYNSFSPQQFQQQNTQQQQQFKPFCQPRCNVNTLETKYSKEGNRPYHFCPACKNAGVKVSNSAGVPPPLVQQQQPPSNQFSQIFPYQQQQQQTSPVQAIPVQQPSQLENIAFQLLEQFKQHNQNVHNIYTLLGELFPNKKDTDDIVQ